MHKLISYIVPLFFIVACKQPEARKPISAKTGSFIKISAKRNKTLNQKDLEIIKSITNEDTLNTYITSNSGFIYAYKHKAIDTLKTAQFGDYVYYKNTISTINNTIIYPSKSYRHIVDKEHIFRGLNDALKLLRKGDTAIVYFPSQLAYGYYGDEKKIGTNVSLKCNISIDSIITNK